MHGATFSGSNNNSRRNNSRAEHPTSGGTRSIGGGVVGGGVAGFGVVGAANAYEIANQESSSEDERGLVGSRLRGTGHNNSNIMRASDTTTATEDENDDGGNGSSMSASSPLRAQDHDEHDGRQDRDIHRNVEGIVMKGQQKTKRINIHKGGVGGGGDDAESDVSSFDLQTEIANTPKKWYETKCARTLFYIMGILYMFPWGTVFFVVAALTVVEIEHKESRQHPATHTNRSLQYEHMAQLDSKMYLYWNNPDLKTKTVDLHIVYYGIGWVALGVSPPNDSIPEDVSILSASEEAWDDINLEGAEAVIGLPLKTPPVQLYELTSPTFSFDSVHLKPKSEQWTIQDTLLVQSSTKTELSFIMNLDPPPRVDASEPSTLISIDPEGETTFIFAYGASNAFGHVLDAGLYTLDFAKYAKNKHDSNNENQDENEGADQQNGEKSHGASASNDNNNNADNSGTGSSTTETASTPMSDEEAAMSDEEAELVNEMTTSTSDIYTADDGGASNHHKNSASSTSTGSTTTSSGAAGERISCVPSQDPAYQFTFFPTQNKDEYFVSYRVDEETNVLHGKMAYHKPNRWLGWGISPDGSGNMIGSHAIIGIPNDEGASGLYGLTSKHVSGIIHTTTTSPDDDISVTYSDSTNNLNSVMSFTTKLPSTGSSTTAEITSSPLTVIWAVGSSDTLGYHEERGSYDIILSTCSVTLRKEEQVEEEGTNYAAASNNPEEGQQVKQKKKPVMALLYLHGILMALAFLIVVPISVSCAMLKHLYRQYWFFTHMGLNILAGCLSVLAFLCAVFAIGKGNNQISHFGSTHQIVGLIILVLVAIQITAALLRPQSQDSSSSNNINNGVGGGDPNTITTTNVRSELSSSPLTTNNDISFQSHHRGTADIDLDDWFGDMLDRVNCSRRLLWQTCHSYNGTLILILGLVQVYDGMDKLETSYGVRWKVTALFWAIFIPWLVTLLLMLWIQRGRVQKERTTQRGDILPDFATHMEDVERHDMLVPAVISHPGEGSSDEDDDDDDEHRNMNVRSPPSFV